MKIHNYGNDYAFQQQKKEAIMQTEHNVKSTEEMIDYAEYQVQTDRETSVATTIGETEPQSSKTASRTKETSQKRKCRKEKE